MSYHPRIISSRPIHIIANHRIASILAILNMINSGSQINSNKQGKKEYTSHLVSSISIKKLNLLIFQVNSSQMVKPSSHAIKENEVVGVMHSG
ncbi:predicted protein [Sclerotinia sclerotiorum 1980 UF-70]|uniref:Uncharacterized protein n=1 Tax=Sclerotinia sclerotiorum (strain ATCC 18683 / 1980 / Ss-1) TaxID=665079 RepID=A7ENR6_SCLS1|nr:predicted protein [Sclerotinia sclerotiorum 1980 UF-70]EDO04482.1 predicted protein [Sclerotinia sclerotiorum 1980 UF-70]